MIVNQKQLYKCIDEILKPNGFIRKKDTWYLHTTECICFIIFAKSPYAGRYGELMGVFLKEINNEGDFPSYEKAHLKYNIKWLMDSEKVKQILNLENNEFKDNERENAIRNILENYAIPFIRKLSTKQGIINAISEYDDLVYYARLSLKEKLDISDKG
ncbi:MAG: DUF4304 domain-containing protein [Agriterribacter sp.]